MKYIYIIWMIVASSLLIAQDSLQNKSSNIEYYKVSKVRIYINDPLDLQELRREGLSFERVKYQDGYFDTFIDEYEMKILKKFGHKYEIIIPDVTKDYLERTKESREKILKLKKKADKPCGIGNFGYGSMGGFYTFDEVVAELDAMHQLYPNIITEKDSVGSSIEGRPIWTVKISDNPEINEDEPEIFYNSLIHAREPEGMMAVMKFMYYLLENYGTDPEVTYLVNNRELFFMPVINPDGYKYNQTISPNGGGMWRKNRRIIGGSVGIDLNRNFGYMWGYDNLGSSPNTMSGEYRGSGPFSEPETHTILEYCAGHNFSISANYHSYWNVVFAPWSYNLQQTAESTIFDRLITHATFFNGYRNGFNLPSWENYPSNGGVCDWMYGETSEKNRIYGVLPEVGGDEDGFWPIPERIFPLAEENIYPNLVYAWGPGIVQDVPYIESAQLNSNYFNPLSDTLNISVVESNPSNYQNTITAEILSSDNSLINTIQLEKVDTLFKGSLSLNSYDEDFYSIRLTQSGTDLPFKFYSDEPKFTTIGPLELVSYNATRLDSNTLFLDNFLLANKSASNTVSSVSINVYSKNDCLISMDGEKQLNDFPPGSQISMDEGFVFSISDCVLDTADLTIEILSRGTKYWENKINMEIPQNFEKENYITVFYDEANDMLNWISEGGWDITSENSVSPPYSFTDSPNGDYSDYANAKLTSKNNFKLLNSIHSFIEFDTKWTIDSWDYAAAQISIDDGKNWTSLKGNYTQPGGGEYQPNGIPLYCGVQPTWVHEVMDISQYTNHSFKLRFLLKASQYYNGDGWYIDNIKMKTYSAIYGDHLFMDKSYARKNIDSVQFNVRFLNPNGHDFVSNLIYSNDDLSVIDSVTLFDDGLHGDLEGNDNIYGNYILSPQTEDFYSLSVATQDYQMDKYFRIDNLFKFTNMGPIVVDTFSLVYPNDSLIAITDLYLINLGEFEEVNYVSANLICIDSSKSEVTRSSTQFGTIRTGESKKAVNYLAYVKKSNSSTDRFLLEISSNNSPYWYDTLTISIDTIDTDVENSQTDLPIIFALHQNYPNPFNPVTTIKYSIPKQSNVTLKVYDVLGSEVVTLVNKEQSHGNYEVEFDGSELSSGIYFYRMHAGKYAETKKMMLIK